MGAQASIILKNRNRRKLQFPQFYSKIAAYPNFFLLVIFMRISFAALAASLGLAAPLSAQSIDANDLLQRFEAQRDAFGGAADNGPTRNLVLVTVDDLNVEAQDQSPTMAAPDSDTALEPLTTTTTDSTTSTTLTPLQAPDPDNAVEVASADPAAPASATYGRLAEELQVNLFINFAFDSAAIAADQRPVLDEICPVMRDSDINLFQIVGHTDTSGPDDYNERLSRLRAEEVSRYLISSCEIDSSRLTTLGLGERFPRNADNPRADENRRVEFQALS